MQVYGSTEFTIEGESYEVWILPAQEEDIIAEVAIQSSQSIQVYDLLELTEKNFSNMEFEVEDEQCMFCLETKNNCASRIAHRLKDMDKVLPDSAEDSPKPIPEYVCQDCMYIFSDKVSQWVEDNPEMIMSYKI